MPDPSRSAGGTPDDWNNDRKAGPGLCLIMITSLAIGLVAGLLTFLAVTQ